MPRSAVPNELPDDLAFHSTELRYGAFGERQALTFAASRNWVRYRRTMSRRSLGCLQSYGEEFGARSPPPSSPSLSSPRASSKLRALSELSGVGERGGQTDDGFPLFTRKELGAVASRREKRPKRRSGTNWRAPETSIVTVAAPCTTRSSAISHAELPEPTTSTRSPRKAAPLR